MGAQQKDTQTSILNPLLFSNPFLRVTIDITSTSHILSHDLPGLLSSIPPFVYQFTGAFCPQQHRRFQDPWGSEVIDPFVAPMALLDQSFLDRSCLLRRGFWFLPRVLCFSCCCLVKKMSMAVFFFAKMVKNVKCWSWNSKWREVVVWSTHFWFRRDSIEDWNYLHKSSVMGSRKSVAYCVETESSCWWKVQIAVSLGGFTYIFYDHPYLWKIANLASIFFQMGWNHQPEVVSVLCQESVLLLNLFFFWSHLKL